MNVKHLPSAVAVISTLALGSLSFNVDNTYIQVSPVAQAASIPLGDFNGRLYQAHRGSDNKIYTRSFNGATWTGWEQAGSTLTYSAPAIAAFNGRLYQAHRGSDNKIYTRSFDGATWTGWEQAGSTLTYSAPAIAAFNGRLYQAHRGSDNKIYTRSFDGATWTGWEQAGSTLTYSAPAIAAFNGRLYQAHRGSDNKIYTRSFDGATWTGWEQAGSTLTYSAPAIAAFNGRLYQAHRGSDNKIYTRSFNGATWTGWEQAGGTVAYSAPTMIAVNGKLYQTHQGGDNKIYTRSFDGATWTGWTAPQADFTPPEADDLEGAFDPGNLLSLSANNQRGVLGIVSSSLNYSSKGNRIVAGNGTGETYLWCTDYAYGRALEKGLIRNGSGTSFGIGGVISGDAGRWDDSVKVYYPNSINSTPRSNSIVVWDPNQGGAFAQGHVGFVEAVFSDNSFLISESNYGSKMSFGMRRIVPGTSAYQTAKFIYLR